jgi:hypothetical protein
MALTKRYSMIKRCVVVACFSISFCLCNIGQVSSPRTSWVGEKVSVKSQAAHEKVWERVTTFLGDDSTWQQTNSFIQLATGQSRWSPEESKWVDADTEITIANGEADALKTCYTVHFAANINNIQGAITLTTAEGQRLRSQPIGLAYTETTTGRSVFIAELQNAVGAVVGKDKLLYQDAFDGDIDIVYSVKLSSFEQDIVLRSQVPSPAAFNMNPGDTRLEVWTQFLEPGNPQIQQGTIRRGENPDSDDLISFGNMQIASGRAFQLGANDETDWPISKTWWREPNGMIFLVESIPFFEIQAAVQALPPPAQAFVTPKADALKAFTQSSSRTRRKPVSLADVSKKETGDKPGRLASIKRALELKRQRGLVLDYVILATTSDYTFQSDTTYYVNSDINLSGKTTLEAAVIKFTNYNSSTLIPNINILGTLDCQTAQFHPAVFCSKDDSTIGEAIPSAGSISGKYANRPLKFSNSGNSFSVSNIKVRDAVYGISFYSGTNNEVKHSQFVNCDNGVEVSSADAFARNILVYRAKTNAFKSASGKIVGENVTVDGANSLTNGTGSGYAFTFTNSILSGCTNTPVFGGSFNFTASPSTAFQTVGDAAHYLASGSSLRDAGTSNINVALLAELQSRTTYPPLVKSNVWLTNYMTLFPQAQRDTDTVDAGYHYDPLDHAFYLALGTNIDITIQPGTCIGTFGDSSTYGLGLHAATTLNSVGTQENPVRFVRYNLVQEQANGSWASTSAARSFYSFGFTNAAVAPRIAFTFTDWYMPALDGYDFNIAASSNQVIPVLHNRLFGGKVYQQGSAMNFTNCFFERADTLAVLPATAGFENCTFWRGTLRTLSMDTNSYLYNNFFDQTSLTFTNGPTHDFNAYQTNYPYFNPVGAHDVILTSPMTYTNKTFGKFYQTITNLANVGSTSATNVGLYHFTLQSSEAKETNSVVDIGFHYVAASSGAPVDTDSDGAPDYLEDLNGNGTLDSGETKLNDAADLGFRVFITQPPAYPNIP